jgi:hypothetical protein
MCVSHRFQEHFTVQGVAPVLGGMSRSDFADYPIFEIVPPDDLVRTPFAWLYLGFRARDPRIPNAAVSMRWNPRSPHGPYQYSVLGTERMTLTQLGQLNAFAAGMIYGRNRGGRPRERNLCAKDLFEIARNWMVQNNSSKCPTSQQLAEEAEISTDSVSRALTDYDLDYPSFRKLVQDMSRSTL